MGSATVPPGPLPQPAPPPEGATKFPTALLAGTQGLQTGAWGGAGILRVRPQQMKITKDA